MAPGLETDGLPAGGGLGGGEEDGAEGEDTLFPGAAQQAAALLHNGFDTAQAQAVLLREGVFFPGGTKGQAVGAKLHRGGAGVLQRRI